MSSFTLLSSVTGTPYQTPFIILPSTVGGQPLLSVILYDATVGIKETISFASIFVYILVIPYLL